MIRAADLDDMAVRRLFSLRWILHHLVEETARHLGHLDLLCELADGRTGWIGPQGEGRRSGARR